MISTPRLRPRLATASPLLAALAAMTLMMQAGAACAGPFGLTVDVYPQGPMPPGPDDYSVVVLEIRFDLQEGGDDWMLFGEEWIDPRNERGERPFDWRAYQLVDWEMLYHMPGLSGAMTVVYRIWPDSPTGRFAGGKYEITGVRYDADGSPIYATDTVTFGFVVPGALAAVPEPAAAIPAATAASAAAALAMARRRRTG